MRSGRAHSGLLIAGLLLAGAMGPAVADVNFTPQICVRAPHDRLCPHFPDDQTDFSAVFEYRLINTAAQDPFDHHAWQAFVALNWPLGVDGTPVAALDLVPDAPDTRRVWSRFARRDDVFRPDRAATCPDSADVIVRTSDLVQADGTVLTDQSGNFVVYETRLNPVAEAYIRDNALDSRAGQASFDPRPVEFPQGRLGAQATPASVLLKTSWRVMQAGETGYLTASGLIHVPADRSASAAPMCLPVTLGMVGMHIVTRVASGNGDEWLWTTFEHRDNAPIAGSARHVNSLFALELFPQGCTHPPHAAGRNWSFYNPARVDRPTNTPPDGGDWSWAARPPYALIGGEPAIPPQIVRCWDLMEGTRAVNAIWQARLAETELRNYMLVSSQWRGANSSPLFPHGELPRFLTNTTVETFAQIDPDGTCLGCHTAARTATGADANFTFLLRNAE